MEHKFAKIEVYSPDGELLVNDIFRLPLTIGRQSSATVSIPDAPQDISRIHVRLKESEDGMVLDDESTYGT